MMDQAIKDFAKQFEYEPVIENEAALKRSEKVIINGMGGSHIAGDVIRDIDPSARISIHRTYGLPKWHQEELQKSLVIASSYSGNTEEVIAGYKQAREASLSLAAIAVGGKLIEQAQADGTPYIQMPNTGIQPRSALGFSYLGTLKLLGRDGLIVEAQSLASRLQPAKLESDGKHLAATLRGKVPVLYAGPRNFSVVWNWKIKFNETGKIPAFYNIFPELNHNEMTGFDVRDSVQALTDPFHFIMFTDAQDHPRVQKRMEITKKLYEDRGLSVTMLELTGDSHAEKIFTSLILADWTAYYTSQGYGLESEQVPMVEEFKELIAK